MDLSGFACMYRSVAVQPELQEEVGEDEREDERDRKKRRRRGGSEKWWETEAPSRDNSGDIR